MKLAKLQAAKALRVVVQAKIEDGEELTRECILGAVMGITALIFDIYGKEAADEASEAMLTALERSQVPE